MTDVPRKAAKTVGRIAMLPLRITGKVVTGSARRLTGRGEREGSPVRRRGKR